MLAFRIADARHPIFSAAGAALRGGRWNSVGQPVIYAAETYAGALLEILAHTNLSVAPANHKVVTIDIPESVAVETLSASDLPGWNDEDVSVARSFGDQWLREARTAVLRVPGVVAGGRENNVLLNPLHAQFPLIKASAPEQIFWDARVFKAR